MDIDHPTEAVQMSWNDVTQHLLFVRWTKCEKRKLLFVTWCIHVDSLQHSCEDPTRLTGRGQFFEFI